MNRLTKTLGKTFLKLEIRSKDGSRRKLILLLLSYFLTGSFLSVLIYKQNIDPSGFEYIFLTYLFFSMIIVFTSVTELDNLIISRPEIETLAFLPLKDKLVVNAKMFVLRRYILIVALPLLIPGSFFYYLIISSVPHTILYIFSGVLLTMFIVTLLLLLYSLAVRNLRIERINNYTLLFQILVILVMIFGYQYISYSFSNHSQTDIGVVYTVLESRDLLRFFPHSWFSFIASKADYIFNYKLLLKFILPFIVTYAGYLTLKYYLADNYSRIYEKLLLSRSVSVPAKNSGLENPKSFTGRFNCLFSGFFRIYLNKNSFEQSAFTLMRYMFSRDKAVRLSILLMAVIPLGLALFALLTGKLYSPFKQYFLSPRPVFHISILITVFIVIYTAILSVRVTTDPEAAWVYGAYPLTSRKKFINGVRKFFFIYLILPLCLLLLIVFSFKMPLYEALLHSLYILISAELLNSIYHIFSKNLPFTKTNTLLNSIQRLVSLLLPLGYGIIFAVIQFFVYQRMLYSLLTILILILLNFTLVNLFLKKTFAV